MNAGERLAVRRQRHPEGTTLLLATEVVELPAGRQVPKAKRAVVAGGDQALAVRREGNAADVARACGELPCLGAGRHVPDADFAVAPAARDQGLAVRRER